MPTDELMKKRHSAAHVMAAAVQNLYANVKFDIGPATEEGFYYDFDMEHRLTPDDLPRIEEEMRRLMTMADPFICEEYTSERAQSLLTSKKQSYKLERLADIPATDKITFYTCGDFVDLCRGPHVSDTSKIGSFKLLSIAGSYYRGKETNPMLQRIYGTAFSHPKELKEYLQRLEEAKKRDHRKLGTELELFSVSEDIGSGLILWHPNGALTRHVIETFWRDMHYQNGYHLVNSPHLGLANLWETSGHLDFYKESMYAPLEIDERNYYIKPMNCPFHIKIYQTRNRSYRELPLRWAELGTVYRYEKSGVLHGLLRVRGFTQDDAHIFCTPDQVENEISQVLQFCLYIWKAFGFADVKAYLATRPPKAVGDPAYWDKAISSLEKAVKNAKLDCEVDPGGGAFYGPKIDLKIKDAIGREWQTSTIQFDFNLPERFDLYYIGEDGKKHRPYMVHRALLGSLERFFGILIEHYAGALPAWLAPVQARILPITERHHSYACQVEEILRQKNLRVHSDLASESLGAKIRKARNERIPYLLVVGDHEVENQEIAVRKRGANDATAMSVDKFIHNLLEEVAARH